MLTVSLEPFLHFIIAVDCLKLSLAVACWLQFSWLVWWHTVGMSTDKKRYMFWWSSFHCTY